MAELLEVVNKESVPQRGLGGPLSPRITEMLNALKKLGSNEALKYQCKNRKEARLLQTSLIYHFNRRHRPGIPTMSNLRCSRRDTVLFIWLEGK